MSLISDLISSNKLSSLDGDVDVLGWLCWEWDETSRTDLLTTFSRLITRLSILLVSRYFSLLVFLTVTEPDENEILKSRTK